MPNPIAGELGLRVGTELYTLKFTNASYAELEEDLRGGALDTAIGRGLNLKILSTLLWLATRRFHAAELPDRDSVEELMDELEDFDGTLLTVLSAYQAGQPAPQEEEEEPEGESFSSKDAKKPEPFSWRNFLKQAVECGIKPQEFWEMSPDEAQLWIKGYEKRQDQAGELWAHFNAALMNNSRTKKDKKVKPKDLYQSSTKKKKPAEVVSIEERRELMRELKQELGSPVGRRKKNDPE